MNPSIQNALQQLNTLILGKETVMQQLLACVLAGGHVLLEDVPGVGKTTLAHGVAAVLGLNYRRVQFTNDMLPSDLLGINIYRPDEGKFEFHPGPVFHSFLLADEINRASPKLQSALLEAMEEKQVSVDGKTYRLPRPFLVVATQNPVEQLGTFPLPESQLDRFMMRLSMGYPSEEAEKRLYMEGDKRQTLAAVKAVCNAETLVQWQQQAAEVKCSPAVAEYVFRLVQATRQPGRFVTGLSPRAGLAVIAAAKAWAFMQGRAHILPDDVKAVWVPVAAHRLQSVQQQHSSRQILEGLLNHVAVS
ncbi:AAA family ATPase [Neisseria wadsworthii]|uniref:Methanol dehydrogenase regulatory protein n=1 Tax=Neisseria wadsworthii 9715 TaxID=1030841 RepID=G4CTL0_9NEIS|nr:MoxR family ATPase [Neisseria wadsworthii]EGZ44115.1 methanol dehydrogenase regulatory protein [Neisseria wadsworthii 9715]QMT35992.1 MoxR family ATPase [Neisseria wadsworthii]